MERRAVHKARVGNERQPRVSDIAYIPTRLPLYGNIVWSSFVYGDKNDHYSIIVRYSSTCFRVRITPLLSPIRIAGTLNTRVISYYALFRRNNYYCGIVRFILYIFPRPSSVHFYQQLFSPLLQHRTAAETETDKPINSHLFRLVNNERFRIILNVLSVLSHYNHVQACILYVRWQNVTMYDIVSRQIRIVLCLPTYLFYVNHLDESVWALIVAYGAAHKINFIITIGYCTRNANFHTLFFIYSHLNCNFIKCSGTFA